MKAFYSLTDTEKLALNEATFVDSVVLEAINRKLTLPLETADLVLTRSFNHPTEPSQSFYELVSSDGYNPRPTGIAFTSEGMALRALENAVLIREEYNYNTRTTTRSLSNEVEKLGVRVVVLPKYTTKTPNLIPKVEDRDTSEFDNLFTECESILSNLRADDYNRKLRIREAQKFFTLAKGDLSIATAFWNNYYPTLPFPSEEERASIPLNP